ncbi:sodium:solute symporter family transporter [Candidatus Pelagibacter communis]|uniref:Sodium:solute transporter family n=1 Tax=Pelagibacter ubique (strain HTCC1062) TaxID=335992 RepID=Q4FMG0_PELUB|nr:sodium/solute transporter family [Candidatus Pelagibacter ubique]AAZ21629.1 sodium:solute transporter family [Candidatus Pelagibacter ubique HTCC1062]MDA7447317.1 sodium:solute symporter [Candidatus Pelagibacter ubique]MDC1541017.1 sodium:solute symporter [Candidatus Pelagibacter ubique]
MDKTYFISQSTSLTLVITISLIFTIVGLIYSKKYQGINNYLTANRNIGFFSLTTSLIASALGAWILFGPASAATWGGIGAVIGYALGTAFPMIFLISLGKKIRTDFPKGSTLIEFLRKRFGKSLFKLILLMTVFYMFVFLCAEITAVAILINYISGTELWVTSLIILIATLAYTLYGGLRASIFTDNIQMIVIVALLLISVFYLTSFTGDQFSFSFIKEKSPHLLSASYIPNYTAGLTFFIAVAATNLFHQGNWQRVYAAKNNEVLKKSLIVAFIVIIPIVFFMGFSGLVAVSANPKVIPDLGFFSLLLSEQTEFLSLIIVILGLSLTISTVDTLVNAISSLIVVDGKATLNLNKKTNYLTLSKYFIVVLSIIAFVIASKGFSVLYLFLLADLFCCAFVLTVFYSFYNKKLNEKTAYISIIIGLIGGFLLFPAPDFSKSLLVGIILPADTFPAFVSQSLLFLSFIIATFLPVIFWKIKGSKK